jgi:hypothetical protein
MAIDKMLTISNNHIRCETMRFLHIEQYLCDHWYLTIWPKGEYGKFIYIDKQEFKKAAKRKDFDMPKDLVEAIMFAIDSKCSILCLDPSGEQVDDLRYYDD